MSGIKSLGYIGLDVSDVDAWNGLLQSVFALQLRTTQPNGAWQYKMDSMHHRLSLYPGERDGLNNVGWEVRSQADLDHLVAKLEAAEIYTEALSASECADRAVLGGVVFTEPVTKVRTELFFGAVVESAQFQPPRAMQGYVTGEQGMGHFVLMTSDLPSAVTFYCDVLGFRVSDTMDFAMGPVPEKGRLVFLHCNARHHSLALMSPPAGGPDGGLNHLAFSVRSFDDIGYAYDIVRENGVPVLMTLGKHSNDLATSFYVANPSQSALEMAYGGIDIDQDESWVVKHYDDTKIWGHTMYLPPRPLS